jgi:hypothetical protein
VAPSRLLDTRLSGPRFGAAESRSLQVTGVGGVPAAGVSAVVLNVTVTDTTGNGYLTVSPSGAARPVVSNLNWFAGATIPNAVTVKVGPDGKVDLFQSGPGTAQVIVDVAGYFVDGDVTEAGGFSAVAPSRILDTRISGGKLAAGEARALQVAGAGDVPSSNVSAVVLNVTVTNTTGIGYLTVFPSGTDRPLASNLNWSPGGEVANMVTVALGSDGKVSLFNSAGVTDVVVDVAGYYLGGTATQPGMFVALSPIRVLDTRSSDPLPGGEELELGGFDPEVGALVVNATVTDTRMAGYLSLFPGDSPLPGTSNVNWTTRNATSANMATVQVGAGGSIVLHNGSPDSVSVVLDVAGYYIR